MNTYVRLIRFCLSLGHSVNKQSIVPAYSKVDCFSLSNCKHVMYALHTQHLLTTVLPNTML